MGFAVEEVDVEGEGIICGRVVGGDGGNVVVVDEFKGCVPASCWEGKWTLEIESFA